MTGNSHGSKAHVDALGRYSTRKAWISRIVTPRTYIGHDLVVKAGEAPLIAGHELAKMFLRSAAEPPRLQPASSSRRGIDAPSLQAMSHTRNS